MSDISFQRPSTKRKLSEIQASPEASPLSAPSKKKEPTPQPTQSELDTFYAQLNNSSPKPAILRVIDGYAENFIPMSRNPKYPRSLSYLYNPDTLDYGYLQLLDECEHVYTSLQVFYSFMCVILEYVATLD